MPEQAPEDAKTRFDAAYARCQRCGGSTMTPAWDRYGVAWSGAHKCPDCWESGLPGFVRRDGRTWAEVQEHDQSAPELARLLDALCTAVEGYGMEDWQYYPEAPPARAAVEAYIREHYRPIRPPLSVVTPEDGETFEALRVGLAACRETLAIFDDEDHRKQRELERLRGALRDIHRQAWHGIQDSGTGPEELGTLEVQALEAIHRAACDALEAP